MVDFKEIIPNNDLWQKIGGYLIVLIITVFIYLKGKRTCECEYSEIDLKTKICKSCHKPLKENQ